jgi:hypothetical protein
MPNQREAGMQTCKITPLNFCAGGDMAIAKVIGNKLFWNLTAAVGVGQPNLLDDVELVRFGYVMYQAATIEPPTPTLRAAMNKMRRAGSFGNELDAVIRAHQAEKNIPVDGKISVAQANLANQGQYDRHHSWIMVNLVAYMSDFDLYPRIDLHPESGPAISVVSKKLRRSS